jgi:NAD(P)-dependent dehydrogenase (short-subunit alcohol dehydrogenase family)
VVAARRLEGLRKLAELTGAAPLRCNAAEWRNIKNLVVFTVKSFKRIDGAMMAAELPVAGSILETDTGGLLRATSANDFGFFHLLQYSTRHMPPTARSSA